MDQIRIRGARTHNLKNLNVDLPRNRLIVITGLSGSGKSSLAFDTLYAEGQRRYVESLSAYARQFLEQMEKPDCDGIEGLSPAIAIEQKGVGRNPRSTVGTVTEIADYLRLLFARVGRAVCWSCGREIAAQTVQQVVDRLLALPADTRLFLYAPVVRDRKGEHRRELDELRRSGSCGFGSVAGLVGWPNAGRSTARVRPDARRPGGRLPLRSADAVPLPAGARAGRSARRLRRARGGFHVRAPRAPASRAPAIRGRARLARTTPPGDALRVATR